MSYRLIYTDFWNDPKVSEEMTAEDRHFYLYLLTNPNTTNCGIYIITQKLMAFQLGYSIESVNVLMDRFEKGYKLIKYNTETRELAIRNWGKYNLTRGGKPVIDCLSSELSKVEDKGLIKYIDEKINNDVISKLYKSFYDTSDGTTGNDTLKMYNLDADLDIDVETKTSTSRERKDIPQGDNTDTNTNTNTYTNTERDTNTDTDDNIFNLSISLIQEYEKLTGHTGVLNLGSIKLAIIQHGYENVKRAIDKAIEKDKLNMSYVNGILRTWAKEGYPKEGEDYGDRKCIKKNRAAANEFKGFKVPEPKGLWEDGGIFSDEDLI